MAVKSKASKLNSNGVTLDTSGDQFSISLKFGTPGIQDPINQVIFGPSIDTTKPVWSGTQSYSYSYQENQSSDALIATVTGATDNKAITQYRFVSSDGASTYGSTSNDGYFSIGSDGKITITSAGVLAGVNNYDDGTTANDYYIQAGDASGNWSNVQQITLNETNDTSDDDSVSPTWNVALSYSYSYQENQSSDALIATVTGATDNKAVTQYRFVNSDGTSIYGSTSNDGYFSIGSDGKITITSTGVTEAVNDYESGDSQSHTYYIQAGDAAGNWSNTQEISLNELNQLVEIPRVSLPYIRDISFYSGNSEQFFGNGVHDEGATRLVPIYGVTIFDSATFKAPGVISSDNYSLDYSTKSGLALIQSTALSDSATDIASFFTNNYIISSNTNNDRWYAVINVDHIGGGTGPSGSVVVYVNDYATAGNSYPTAAMITVIGTYEGISAGSFTAESFNNMPSRIGGTTGSDTLFGAGGADIINGGSGADSITGKGSADVLTGGTGNDLFIYTSANDSTSSSRDTITDFKLNGDNDKIDLSSVLGGGGVAPSAITTLTSTLNGTAGEFQGHDIATFYNGTNTVVFADVNGNNTYDTGDMEILLTGNVSLVTSDFLV